MEYVGIFRGVVVDNADPDNRGRVRVRTESVHTSETPISSIKWAEPCSPFGGDEAINMLYIPPIGSKVWVSFLFGNTAYPVIIGYQRKSNKQIYVDYKKYYGKTGESFFHWGFGQKAQSPFIRFDSLSEKLSLGAGKNTEEFGKQRNIQANNGAGGVALNKNQSVLQYSVDDHEHKVSQGKLGLNLHTSSSRIDTISKNKLSVIGDTLVKSIPDKELGELGIFDSYETLDKVNISASSASEFLGIEAYNMITKIIGLPGYVAGKTLYQNIILLAKNSDEAKKYLDIIAGVPAEAKKFMSRILESTYHPTYFKKLIDTKLTNTLKSIKNKTYKAILGAEKYVENKILGGAKREYILGFKTSTIMQDKEEKIVGSLKQTTMTNVEWKVFKNFGLLVVTGDYKLNIGTGSAEINFNLPSSKLTIQQTLKLSQPKPLVKKIAYDDLVTWVMQIANYLSIHTHNSMLLSLIPIPILPTTLPLLPYPFAADYARNLAAFTAKQLIPAPANPYYTNNLESA